MDVIVHPCSGWNLSLQRNSARKRLSTPTQFNFARQIKRLLIEYIWAKSFIRVYTFIHMWCIQLWLFRRVRMKHRYFIATVTVHNCQEPQAPLFRNFISYWYGHYNDVKLSAIVSQITSLSIIYSTVYSDTDQRKHQNSSSQAFVRGIHRGPVNSPYKWPVTRKMFPFDDVIIIQKGKVFNPWSGTRHGEISTIILKLLCDKESLIDDLDQMHLHLPKDLGSIPS